MRLRTAALAALAAAGAAVWWRRRQSAPPAVQLGLSDGGVHELAAADTGELRALAAEFRRASLADG